jgi:para-nitrobenzyl esterase
MGMMYESPRLLRDGFVLSRLGPLEAYRSGAYNRVPSILGSNRDEVRTFLLFTSQHVRHLLQIPIGMRNQRMYEVTADFGSRAWKAMGVDEPAAAMREVQGPSVYGYRFDWDHAPGVLWLDLARWLGAGHALEIPFVFGRLSLGVVTPLIFDPDHAELDEALSRAMTSYWTQFAYTGDPGAGRDGDLVRWEPWDARGGSFLILDTADDAGIHMSGDTVTLASVIADVARDPRLETPLERCEVYRDMARGGSLISAADYAQREGGACAELLPPPLRY